MVRVIQHGVDRPRTESSSCRYLLIVIVVEHDPVIPLVSGASSASDTDTAQAANGSYLWLAWIERYRQLKVRSFDLDLIVPPDQYPTPTHVPVPTTGAHP